MSLSASLLENVNVHLNRVCKIALYDNFINLKRYVNFHVLLKQNYATEVKRPACMQNYGFASSPSACVVSTKFQVHWVGKTPGEFKQRL
jgi:hypothetical protein